MSSSTPYRRPLVWVGLFLAALVRNHVLAEDLLLLETLPSRLLSTRAQLAEIENAKERLFAIVGDREPERWSSSTLVIVARARLPPVQVDATADALRIAAADGRRSPGSS
jgi:hypothetical protein